MTKNLYHRLRSISVGVLIVLFLSLNTSCVTTNSKLKREYIKKDEAAQQLEDLKKKQEKEIGEVKSELSKKKDDLIQSKDFQLQTVADYLYGANLAFSFYTPPEPGRVSLIINNRVKEAAAATGKTATAEAMEKENARLRKELDETQTSLEDLREEHNKVIAENTKIANASAEYEKEIKRLNDKISEMNTIHADALIKKQDEIIEKQNKINDLEKQRADDAEWQRKMKLKAMGVCGLLALICVAGAIWSPAFKSKFIIGATVFGACAAGIMYVQPWMIAAFFGVVIIGVLLKVAIEHHKVDKTATNLINYVQDQKESNPTVHDKEKLSNYNGKYASDPSTGKTIVVTDPDVEKVIEEKLKSAQRL